MYRQFVLLVVLPLLAVHDVTASEENISADGHPPTTKDERRAAMLNLLKTQIDVDLDGTISVTEMVDWAAEMKELVIVRHTRQWFTELDTDGDQYLSLEEFRPIFEGTKVTDEAVQRRLSVIDLNEDGRVSLWELYNALQEADASIAAALETDYAFETADADRDDLLNLTEFRIINDSIADSKSPYLAHNASDVSVPITELFNMIDVNKDGYISVDESEERIATMAEDKLLALNEVLRQEVENLLGEEKQPIRIETLQEDPATLDKWYESLLTNYGSYLERRTEFAPIEQDDDVEFDEDFNEDEDALPQPDVQKLLSKLSENTNGKENDPELAGDDSAMAKDGEEVDSTKEIIVGHDEL